MGLSIRDLSIYLPYQLRCNVIGLDDKVWEAVELTLISTKSSYEHLCFIDERLIDIMPAELSMIHVENVKPVLRPLDDLESYVLPGLGYTGYDCFTHQEWASFEEGMPLTYILEYREVDILAEAHFDVFNLIHRGLAISIHDVKDRKDFIKDTKKD